MTVINGPHSHTHNHNQSSQANDNSSEHQQERQKGSSKLFSISEVSPELLLCGAAAVNEDALRNWNVGCVVSAAAELPAPPLPPTLATVLRIPVLDNLNEDILSHLHIVADTINEVKLKGGRTLVHCVAGVSRSAALCLGYLVKYHGMSLRRAFTHIRDRRPCIRPNSNFFCQLIEFERQIRGSPSVSMVHNSAAKATIPDVYEEYYENTLHYYNRNYGRN